MSLGLLNTRVEGLRLAGARSFHKVVLLPAGQHDGHLCDARGLYLFWLTIGDGVFQYQRPVGFQNRLFVLPAHCSATD